MSTLNLPENIKIILDDEQPITVKTKDYVKAKTKDLIEFGYSTLTEHDVEVQLNLILANRKEDLSVIGRFIEDEIIVD